MLKEDSIIITSNNEKIKLLKEISKQLLNIKIYTLNELKKLFYFDYNEETIYYVKNKYNINSEIAEIYINNIYNIEDKEYHNDKLIFLSNLKKDLINNNLLIINNLFKNYIKNKNIIIYNLPESKELNNLIKDLRINNNVEIYNEKNNDYKHIIYELNSIEDEVVYIATSICDLLNKGIDINKIYLVNLSTNYRKLIKKIFPMFNINFTLEMEDSIFGTHISNLFFKNYNKDLTITIEKLKENIKDENDEDVLNKIIDIVNKYTFISDKEQVKDMIKVDIKNTKIKTKELKNSVHESNLTNKFNDDEYVFIPSFNQTIIPTIHKDENYLTDNDKKELNISLTVDKNISEKKDLISKLSNIKNCIITYKRQAEGEEYNISNINEQLNYEVIKINELNLSYSNMYNKVKLTSLLDEYNKYNTKSELLYELNNHYKDIKYNTYDNTFKGIQKEDLKEYLGNKLLLSYSSIDKYYRCPFSYYIGNILKLNIYEETFYQLIGSLFHSILEKFKTSNLSFDELWQQEINNLNHEFTNKEKFFLIKLKEELRFVIDVINNQENFTNLHDELYENKIYTSVSGEMNITFMGIIDKIKYKKYNSKTIIAIIDYKTGNPNLDLKTVPYGIGMQLPVYLYLAKNSKKLENIEVAGFYLQKILNNEVAVDKTHTYEQLKKKNLLLQGYSNDNVNILSKFDNSYMDSNIIKSMKTKLDGSFSNYSKTLTTKNMNKLIEIVENKIQEAADGIINVKFDIAPVKIGKVNYGCTLCKFKDICFHTNDDIKELNELTEDDVFGGESNGMD